VCPCAKHAIPPDPPRPPWGCFPRWVTWVIILILILIVIVIVIVRGGDGDSDPVTTPAGGTTEQVDDPPPTDATPPVETDASPPPASDPAPATTQAPASTTTVAPPEPEAGTPPAAVDLTVSTKVTPDQLVPINEILSGPMVTEDKCETVTPGSSSVDQLGATPLVSQVLDVNLTCLAFVTLNGEVPMLVGNFVLGVIVTDQPNDPATNIAVQPGIGINRSAVPNADPDPDGEGLLQIPHDTVGFGSGQDGWTQAQFFSLPGFGQSDLFGYSYSQTGSPVYIFAVPADNLPPDTLFNLQMFGRETAPGNVATEQDPAASTFVLGGPACTDSCRPEADRFKVDLSFAADPDNTTIGAEGDPGLFWFFQPDNSELLVKVLDGCDVEGFNRFWVFSGALTDVQFDMTVTDRQSGEVKAYENPLGGPAPAFTDTAAFATCP